jgi:exodeoxyribonuclease VII large subunit
LQAARASLEAHHPRRILADVRARLGALEPRLVMSLRARLAAERRRLTDLSARLEALSPLAVLERGYAIAERDGAVLRDAAEAARGDEIRVRLHRGALVARVVDAPEPAS